MSVLGGLCALEWSLPKTFLTKQ